MSAVRPGKGDLFAFQEHTHEGCSPMPQGVVCCHCEVKGTVQAERLAGETFWSEWADAGPSSQSLARVRLIMSLRRPDSQRSLIGPAVQDKRSGR